MNRPTAITSWTKSTRPVTLTASGIKKAEAYFKVENLAAAENMTLAHHIDQAIKAYGVMQRDIDYVVKDGQVIIVDEFTGRLMIGRRYNEGLHQAIEAKEGVKVAAESKTLATITFQNYFRMYDKLSGMTGTAKTEAAEFTDIYGWTSSDAHQPAPSSHRLPGRRLQDRGDGKYRASSSRCWNATRRASPCWWVRSAWKRAKRWPRCCKATPQHQRAERQEPRARGRDRGAGRQEGAITIATNMAGRGTDIMLGGNAEFMAKAQMRKEGLLPTNR